MSDTQTVSDALSNPILNGPYDPPARHFEIGAHGPTGEIVEGRRPSRSFIPVPQSKKKKDGEQATLDFETTPARVEEHTLVNDLRYQIDLWRGRSYNGVTPYSRKLLQHWAAGPHREDPTFFCQREAAETAIFFAEVSGRHGYADFRSRVDPENKLHNNGLPRVALKMATGTGKTVVMAMLIAWQTINKVATPKDARFAKKFLIVTPGITIRDRLRVLEPAEEVNYYKERDIVPPDLWDMLLQAQVVITNYHAFMPRTAKEFQGISTVTRKVLLDDRLSKKTEVNPTIESPDQIVARVLRDLGGRGKGEIVVLNDEAHHCYVDKPVASSDDEDKESRERNEEARVWFRGLEHVHKKVGIKAIYDLSATPYYLGGSGYNEGLIFPWVVSDFSLMDAIESGIVKVPRIPVDDDAVGDLPTFLNLWDHIGKKLPKRQGKKAESDSGWVPPQELESALYSLYRSYERAFTRWKEILEPLGEPPPVFIVVCPNTIVSKLVYDWIAGQSVELPSGDEQLKPGNLEILSNVHDGSWLARPHTILIDSQQLESGEALKDDFKKAAASEIAAFKREYSLRNPGVDTENLTDEDLLREVMNTVGKRGKLGEFVRCVVSVSMLTEGWDANTVSHILGIRAFGSQLLCEQVVGRGLRRRSYAINERGRFDPEYADVYGVPFAFIPSDRAIKPEKPMVPAIEVRALESRYHLRITFPKLDGYRIELPDERFHADFDESSALHINHDAVALWTQVQGIVGEAAEQELEQFRSAREQQVAYAVAKVVVRKEGAEGELVTKPWLFPNIVELTREWIRDHLTLDKEVPLGMLLLTEGTHMAAEKVHTGIVKYVGQRDERLLPLLRRFDAEGSTDDVGFFSRKAVVEATKSPVNYVVLDGKNGNTWEESLAELLEGHPKVHSYVKNDHLDFTIPYVHAGRSYDYVPDFLVRLVNPGGDVDRTLIIEVSGSQKSPGPTQAKAQTARHSWCVAVNNHGGFGVWGYVEYTDPAQFARLLNEHIENLYRGGTVTGMHN